MDGSSTDLVATVERFQTVNYVIVASMALLVYDYCLTLVDEVNLVWTSELNVVKILYFFSRYPTFVDTALTVYIDLAPKIPINQCVPINGVISWFITFGIATAELILILRTFALWVRSKKVLYWLLSLFTVCFVASLIITGIFLHTLTARPPLYPSFTGCLLIGGSPIIFFDFIMLVMFETVIVAMTIFRGWRDFRGTRNPLINTLYRDGIVFYLCLFAISFANILVLSLGPVEYQDLLTTFQRLMHSLLSCRIIIHARRVDHQLQTASLPQFDPGSDFSSLS